MNNYKPTIGIEIHLELKTNAKVFSPSKNDYNKGPNTNINEIDLGYPGVLPILNEEVVRKATKASLGLNMKVARKMHFDRKNYFYPDLPKGYQITQMETPIGYDGYISINIDGKEKRIGIERLHIEEDTAKSLHHNGKTLLNYNRSCVPLVEIVSKPDMHSKEEAMAYVERLRELFVYLDVSDCKIEEGSMRCDVNISVSKDDALGVRSEIKNIGSISNIGNAIDYEIKRHVTALENGETLYEDTRRYDAENNSTVFMRKKDTNTDYRYFPEPDIPYLYLDDSFIEEVNSSITMLPDERRKIYLDKDVSSINTEKLIANKELSDYLNMFLESDIDFKIASNILVGDITFYLNKENISIFDTKLDKSKFISVVDALSKNKISSKIFKDILPFLMEEEISLNSLLEREGLSLMSNEDEIISIINVVLLKYPQSVLDYKNGKDNAIKFLMGMVMKESKGKASPKVALDLLKNVLDNN